MEPTNCCACWCHTPVRVGRRFGGRCVSICVADRCGVPVPAVPLCPPLCPPHLDADLICPHHCAAVPGDGADGALTLVQHVVAATQPALGGNEGGQGCFCWVVVVVGRHIRRRPGGGGKRSMPRREAAAS